MTRLSPLLCLAVVAAACGGTRTVVRTVTVQSSDQRFFGHVVGVERVGGGYLLRFDPAWLVSGVTANVAQAAAMRVRCKPTACPPVANDNFRVDEGHTALVFRLPANVRGTVLVGGPQGTKTIGPSQLAALLAHRSPIRLFEPLASGVWIDVRIDTVRRFAQQYAP